MSKIVTLRPEDLKNSFMFSKGNNRKGQPLDFRDASGRPLYGKMRRTLLLGLQLQQERYNTKRLDAELLSLEELKVKVDSIVNNQFKASSTDKQAILDAYYLKQFNEYSKLSKEELEVFSLEGLDDIQKKALSNAYAQLKGKS